MCLVNQHVDYYIYGEYAEVYRDEIIFYSKLSNHKKLCTEFGLINKELQYMVKKPSWL